MSVVRDCDGSGRFDANALRCACDGAVFTVGDSHIAEAEGVDALAEGNVRVARSEDGAVIVDDDTTLGCARAVANVDAFAPRRRYAAAACKVSVVVQQQVPAPTTIIPSSPVPPPRMACSLSVTLKTECEVPSRRNASPS